MTDEMLAATRALAPAVRVADARAHRRPAVASGSSTTCWTLGATRPRPTRPTRSAHRDRRRAATRTSMLATGNSQLAFLAELVHVRRRRLGPRHRRSTWTSTSGSPPTHPASFQRYMRERRRRDACRSRTFHYLDGRHRRRRGRGATATRTCSATHPLDLCCCGIGENGHLAFNDPPVADFDDPLDVKVVELDDACRAQQVGEGHFPTIDDVPTHAITVTIPALLRRVACSRSCPRRARPCRCAPRSKDRSRPRAPRRPCAHSPTRRCTSTATPPRCSPPSPDAGL